MPISYLSSDKYSRMPSIGQAIAFIGILATWDKLDDPYSCLKYYAMAATCLGFVIADKPRRGVLSSVAFVYMVSLAITAGFRPISWVGRNLCYFSAVIPMSLVCVCYHYSLRDRWKDTANVVIMACVAASVASILQGYDMFLPQGDFFNGRVYAFMGSPVFLSGIMAMAIPLCLGRTYTPFAIPLIVTCILLTQSRSGLMAGGMGVLGYCFANKQIGWKSFFVGAILVLASVMGMFSALRDVNASDKGRYHMTRVAFKSIVDNPFGIGPERFSTALAKYRDADLDKDLGVSWSNGYVHNHILQALVDGGPLFLAVHIFTLSLIGFFLYKHGPPAVFGCAVAMCAFGLTQPTPLVLKCILACLVGAIDPTDRPISKTPFVLACCLAFCVSITTVVSAKIASNGARFGLAQMVVDAYQMFPR